MTLKPHLTALAACALAASACASVNETNISDTEIHAPNHTHWTDEEQAAYDQCLQDNMAVATAWEMIEQSCRKQVDGETDPLGLELEE